MQKTNCNPNDLLIPFYMGASQNTSGVTLKQILNWNQSLLESQHDYIQWLFPIDEVSRYNLDSPTLTPEFIQMFKHNPTLRANVYRAFTVMLAFYGLRLNHVSEGVKTIVKARSYENRKQQWVTVRNHNLLRLSRILRCLYLLGLTSYHTALLDALQKIYSENPQIIGDVTLGYWVATNK